MRGGTKRNPDRRDADNQLPQPRANLGAAGRKPPLTVRRSPTGFTVHDPALARLAGFETLPLPFSPEATPDEVLAHLRRLNPHREIHFAEQAGPPPRTLNPEL